MNAINQISRIKLGLVTLVAAFYLTPLSADLSEPARIIEDADGRILDEVDGKRAFYEENPDELKKIVNDELLPLLDHQYSARLILGRHGRGVSGDKLTAFAEALSGQLMNRYSNGLLRFEDRDQMEIMPSTSKDDDQLTRVRTRVRLETGGFAPVDYAFRKTNDEWKVFDVTIEGVSYVMTFRNQIAPQVAERGIDQVTAELNEGRIEITDY
jgi:phospholipid transport system substrate-binding protein